MKLFETMKELVDQHLVAYHSDLEIDKASILKEGKELKEFIWVLRSHGTFLLPINHLKESPNKAGCYLTDSRVIWDSIKDNPSIKLYKITINNGSSSNVNGVLKAVDAAYVNNLPQSKPSKLMLINGEETKKIDHTFYEEEDSPLRSIISRFGIEDLSTYCRFLCY